MRFTGGSSKGRKCGQVTAEKGPPLVFLPYVNINEVICAFEKKVKLPVTMIHVFNRAQSQSKTHTLHVISGQFWEVGGHYIPLPYFISTIMDTVTLPAITSTYKLVAKNKYKDNILSPPPSLSLLLPLSPSFSSSKPSSEGPCSLNEAGHRLTVQAVLQLLSIPLLQSPKF